MKKTCLSIALAAALVLCGCSSEEKKSDLPQEMAAKQLVGEIYLLVKQDKMDEAGKALEDLKNKYGHTQTYAQEKANLLRKGLSHEDMDITLTGKRLVELENLILAYRRETKRWPAPGQIHKPMDAWNNETYWIVGNARNSYDLLVVSAGKDGVPGSGDELLLVWNEEDVGGYKDKRTGKMVGKTQKAKKQNGKKAPAKVMTLDDLKKSEIAAGTKPEDIVDLKQLAAYGRESKQAGQPQKDEMVMSLDEIKDTLK